MPTKLSHIDLPESVWDIDINGDLLAVTMDESTRLYNIADPLHPELLWELPDSSTRVKVKDDRLYFMSPAWIFSIADPSQPVYLGGFAPTSTSVSDADVLGEHLVVAPWNDSGLSVVDVTDAASPSVVATIPLAQHGYKLVRVDGDFAYVLAKGDGLSVFDMSNPAAPQKVASLPYVGNPAELSVGSGFMFVWSSGGSGVFDVTTPTMPTQIISISPVGLHSRSAHAKYAIAGWHDVRLWPIAGMGLGSSTAPTIADIQLGSNEMVRSIAENDTVMAVGTDSFIELWTRLNCE